MEITQFIQKFQDIFDELPTEALTPDTYFRDIDEWDSLAALSLIAMADEEFGVKLSAEDIRTSDTIEDLFTKINKNLNA
jgi:acyl carrier protein